MNNLLQFSDKVRQARLNGDPIVALESTIISHGMPYPQNIETALAVEAEVRAQGVVPATIAIYQGKICVGLSHDELNFFGKQKNIVKASRRDLAYVLSQEIPASTTVAATMICAHLANIDFFVTGGIGGVHRYAEMTFDISADLIELATTPVNVICAGAKSILDLPKTLEYLETQGVPVVGYQTDTLPAFYSCESHEVVSQRLDDIGDIAMMIRYQRQLQLKTGIVITNPVPEAEAIPLHQVETWIKQALVDAEGLQGKAITPYLLQRLNELSNGQTLATNIALIKHNANVGAQIAKRYAELNVGG